MTSLIIVNVLAQIIIRADIKELSGLSRIRLRAAAGSPRLSNHSYFMPITTWTIAIASVPFGFCACWLLCLLASVPVGFCALRLRCLGQGIVLLFRLAGSIFPIGTLRSYIGRLGLRISAEALLPQVTAVTAAATSYARMYYGFSDQLNPDSLYITGRTTLNMTLGPHDNSAPT